MRMKHPEDHRKTVVKLTQKGRALIEKVCPENVRMYKERFGVWTAEEKKELVRLLALYRMGTRKQEMK